MAKKTEKKAPPTHDEIVESWKKDNAVNTREIDYHQFISERGLEIIRVAEGHYDGYDKKKKTTYYGLQQDGIDGLERLSHTYHIKVPDWMVGAKAEDITEAQAKEIAGYIGALNTFLVDTFSGCHNFSDMDIETRTPFLTYLHNESPYKLRKSFKDGKKGSFLRAVRTDNPYEMAWAMLSTPDGDSIGEAYSSDKGYYIRRLCIALSALGDKDFVMNIQEERDLDIKIKQKDYIAECRKRLKSLSDDFFHNRELAAKAEREDLTEKALVAEKDINQKEPVLAKNEQPAETEPTTDVQEKPKPMTLKERFAKLYSAFTGKPENLFTNNNEIGELAKLATPLTQGQENAKGNTNLNLQQSVTDDRRGAAQQLGRQNNASGTGM